MKWIQRTLIYTPNIYKHHQAHSPLYLQSGKPRSLINARYSNLLLSIYSVTFHWNVLICCSFFSRVHVYVRPFLYSFHPFLHLCVHKETPIAWSVMHIPFSFSSLNTHIYIPSHVMLFCMPVFLCVSFFSFLPISICALVCDT